MCDEEVNMSDEDAVGDEDGTGDDVNREDGNLFVKSVETVNESMTLCHEMGIGQGNQVHVFMSQFIRTSHRMKRFNLSYQPLQRSP